LLVWTFIVRVFFALIAIFTLYQLLPELWFHIFHRHVFYRGPRDTRRIALSFDDGPDARYTLQILDILAAHKVVATFFLVGQLATSNPGIVQRILADGHEVASHGHRHRHAWTQWPWQTYADIKQSVDTLKALTSTRVLLYRPPWGAFNLFLPWVSQSLGLQTVLWSSRAIDWKASERPENMTSRVIRAAQPGQIVLLHDAGGDAEAPLNTIAALPGIIENLTRLGFSFCTVGELVEDERSRKLPNNGLYRGYPSPRRILIRMWQIVEITFAWIYRVIPVDSFFRMSPTRWTYGNRIFAETGELLTDGSRCIDLHFQNEVMVSLSSERDNRALLRGLRMVRMGLRDLASILEFHPDYQDVQAICAVTLINRGIEALGFHVEDLPETVRRRRLERYTRFLMGLYHPDGFSRLQQGTQALRLRLVWMSRAELLRMYGDASDNNRA